MEPLQPPVIEPPAKDSSWKHAIAHFMSRRIRHIHASPNEWYRIHRSGGGKGFGPLLLVGGGVFACWLAYKVFMWLVEIIQAVIRGICECLVVAVPFALLGVILVAVGTLLWQRKRGY